MSRLTREFLKSNTLIFFPATEGESVYIQQRLLKLGLHWNGGERKVGYTGTTVQKGLIVHRGVMWTGNEEVALDCIVADVRDLSPHTARIEERLDALEKKIDAVAEHLGPREIGLGLPVKGKKKHAPDR